MYGLNTAKILWQLLDLARRRYKRYDDVQLPTQTLSLLLCGSYWLQQGELPAIIQNQLRIHNQRQMPFSSEVKTMAVADVSESDVESLRGTVATLSAEVGFRGTYATDFPSLV